jgi:hypothetical protein
MEPEGSLSCSEEPAEYLGTYYVKQIYSHLED